MNNVLIYEYERKIIVARRAPSATDDDDRLIKCNRRWRNELLKTMSFQKKKTPISFAMRCKKAARTISFIMRVITEF